MKVLLIDRYANSLASMKPIVCYIQIENTSISSVVLRAEIRQAIWVVRGGWGVPHLDSSVHHNALVDQARVVREPSRKAEVKRDVLNRR